jgi:general secretion pathway protein K
MKIPFSDNRGAVALVLVLWVVVVLIVIAGQFAYSMRTEINIVRNFKEEEESYQLAMAGMEKAKLEILLASPSSVVYLDEDSNLIFDDESEEIEKPVRSGTLGKGRYEYTIVDEDRKLNINTASVEQLKCCKDGLFDTIEELLLVRGMTREIFYGTDKEKTEDREPQDDEPDVFKGVAEYLTVVDVKKVNINTAHYNVLESILGIQLAENIAEQRETEPYKRPLSNNNQVSASHYTIISTGTSEDGKIKRTIKSIVKIRGKMLENLYWNDNFIG